LQDLSAQAKLRKKLQEAAARTPTISRDISELINQHKSSSDATMPPVYTAALFMRF